MGPKYDDFRASRRAVMEVSDFFDDCAALNINQEF